MQVGELVARNLRPLSLYDCAGEAAGSACNQQGQHAGWRFRACISRLCCVPQCKDAKTYPLATSCPYKAVFEPSPPSDKTFPGPLSFGRHRLHKHVSSQASGSNFEAIDSRFASPARQRTPAGLPPPTPQLHNSGKARHSGVNCTNEGSGHPEGYTTSNPMTGYSVPPEGRGYLAQHCQTSNCKHR